MRVVIDTNVFVSGIFWPGPSHTILKAWRDGIVQPAVCPEIVDEYRRVSAQLSADFPDIDISRWIDLIALSAIVVSITPPPAPICSDPDDDKFLLCAVAAKAGAVITGDKALLATDGYKGVEVMKPRPFVEKHLLFQ